MKIRDRDIIGQDIAASPHFHVMPGMRIQSPDGWARVSEGECHRWEGWPDMADVATVGCLVHIAWRIVEREKGLSAKRQEMFFPTTFDAKSLDSARTIEVPNIVWAYDRLMRAILLQGIISLESIKELRNVFMEAAE